MMEKRCLPQTYALKMLNAALATRTNRDKTTEEENQSYKYKRSRFDPFDVDPDDPFDFSKSKSGTEYHDTDSCSVGSQRVSPHKEGNQPRKWPRLVHFDNVPDDHVDSLKSKSMNAQDPTDQDWTDCDNCDSSYVHRPIVSFHSENNHPHKWSRFDNVPDDPADALKSKSGNDWNAQDPTDQDWTDCNDRDPDYVPDSLGSESDSNEVPMQSVPQRTLSILDVEQSAPQKTLRILDVEQSALQKNLSILDVEQSASNTSTDITHNFESSSKKSKRPCLYCGVFHAQLVRHLKRKHQDEEAAAAALKLPKVEQGRALADIRKLGIYEYNVARRNENPSAPLIKERRQCSVLMCSGCKGFFDSKTIWKHKKRCFSDGQLYSVNVSSLSNDAKSLDLPEDFNFKIQVVNAFRKDPVGTLCRNDKVILIMGKKWWAKSERKDKHTIMAEMRLYVNIIMEIMRKCSQQDITGEDVNRDYFEFLNKAIVTLTTKESGDASMKSGLKLRIGFLLKKAINILKGYYILTALRIKRKKWADLLQFFS